MNYKSSYFGGHIQKIIRGYNLVSFMILGGNWKDYDFLNLGYVSSKPLPFQLDNRDKDNTNSISLYAKILEDLPANTGSILEIGSGLGGGCYLLKKYYHIPTVTGIDYAKLNVRYSNKKFNHLGVQYYRCSAENANTLNQKYDAVISVEAALLFYNWELFLKNVSDLITDNGTFLYTDLFTQEDKQTIENLISKVGLKIISMEDIGDGVINSIQQIPGPNKDTFLFKFLKKLLLLGDLDKFDAYNNSELHKKIIHKELIYMKYVIVKDK
jgi:SAM-dependent methyltransferase